MGVPFSREVQKASLHIDNIAPTVNLALWTIIWVSIIISFLIGALLIAITALLVTVNPDLAEERRFLVTPVLKVLLKIPLALVERPAGTGLRREDDKSERSATGYVENKAKYRG
jgi:hypothetical protein